MQNYNTRCTWSGQILGAFAVRALGRTGPALGTAVDFS
jgi:hypothetical protein